MSSSNIIELDDLSAKNVINDDQTDSSDTGNPTLKDATISAWVWVATTFLSIIAAILILFPRLLLFASDGGRATLTALESYLALHYGILLIAVTLTLLFNIPSASPPIAPRTQQQSPSHHPLLGPLSCASILSAFISYNTPSVRPLSSFMSFFFAIIGLWGLWVILFSGTSFVSKKTGADKHTSAFIFGNKNAASVQKRRWKQQQQAVKPR